MRNWTTESKRHSSARDRNTGGVWDNGGGEGVTDDAAVVSNAWAQIVRRKRQRVDGRVGVVVVGGTFAVTDI